MRKIDVEIIEKLNADDSIQIESIEELRTQFENECAKDNPDYELIDEIAMLMAEKDGSADKINISDEIAELKRKTSIKPKRFFVPKWAAAMCASLILVLGLNAYSAYAWNMNIFKAVVKFINGGVVIGFENEQPVIELPTSENDTYGIRTKCAEYDVYPLVPEYIPEEFVLTDIQTDINDHWTQIRFFYKKDEIILNFDFFKYQRKEYIPDFTIPTDTYNITERELNGQTMYILKEDNQFTATFLDNNNIIYAVYADGLDYDECDKVIESLR